jgi:hypothetical protein
MKTFENTEKPKEFQNHKKKIECIWETENSQNTEPIQT